MQVCFFSGIGLLLAQGADNPMGDMFRFLLPMLLIGLVFYFLMIRPERRKRAELAQMLEQLKKNDSVVTIGGIAGTVVNSPQGSEFVTIRVDESTNCKIRVQRNAIARVIAPEKAAAEESEKGSST